MAHIARFAFRVRSFVIAVSVRNQGRELQRNTISAFSVPVGDDLAACEFRFMASEKSVRLVYINLLNGSLHEQFFLDKTLVGFCHSC